jgi:sn-glycerol 3-phosphate transport system permease protein
MAGRRVRLVVRYAVLTAVAAIVLFPLYVTVVNSLLPSSQLLARPPKLFPTSPQWSTYRDAWEAGHLSRYLQNSIIVTALIVVGQVSTSILAAYAFAFLQFPLKRTMFVVFLATTMIPLEVTFFTNLDTIVSLGWYDTYAALAVPFVATGFGTFLLRQAFLQVPRDLQDAAALDGYGHLRFMARVAVPLARPMVAALALFSFFSAWNQYLWPLIVTRDDRLRTVQIGLRQLRGEAVNDINIALAGTVLAALPLFILLIVFQKQLIRGLTAGAVKG